MVLLPSNITVFTLDFSGSGLSEGDYVSLGWHEVCFRVLLSQGSSSFPYLNFFFLNLS
jgi:hypothetical protein